MTVNPTFIHGSPGSGGVLFVQVSRVLGFRGEVDVALANQPSWVQANPLIINSTSRNATLIIVLSKDAPKGSYSLTVVGTAQDSAKQSVMFQMKVVSVTPVTSDSGSALVYETTKILDSATLAALVSYQNGTLSFRQSTPQLEDIAPGDVLAVPPKASQIAPNGILRFVLDKQDEGGAILLKTRQAGLAEAFQELHFGQPPNATGSGAGLGPASSRISSRYGKNYTTASWRLHATRYAPFSIGGDVKFNLGLTYDASLWGYLDISWAGCDSVTSCHGPRVDDAGLIFQATEHAYISLTGSAGSTLKWDKDNILKDPLYNDAIIIIPYLLWLHITVNLHGHAQGTLKQDINLGVDQQFILNEGPYYDHNNGWQWMNEVNPPLNTVDTIDRPSSSDSGDSPRVEVGPST